MSCCASDVFLDEPIWCAHQSVSLLLNASSALLTAEIDHTASVTCRPRALGPSDPQGAFFVPAARPKPGFACKHTHSKDKQQTVGSKGQKPTRPSASGPNAELCCIQNPDGHPGGSCGWLDHPSAASYEDWVCLRERAVLFWGWGFRYRWIGETASIPLLQSPENTWHRKRVVGQMKGKANVIVHPCVCSSQRRLGASLQQMEGLRGV